MFFHFHLRIQSPLLMFIPQTELIQVLGDATTRLIFLAHIACPFPSLSISSQFRAYILLIYTFF